MKDNRLSCYVVTFVVSCCQLLKWEMWDVVSYQKFKQSTISLIWTTLRGEKKSTWNALLAAWKGDIFISLHPYRIIERVKNCL